MEETLIRFNDDLPAAMPPWAGLPRYNFIGGHNDPERVPVEALARAADTALRAHASKLARYNLGTGPFGFEGLRDAISARLAQYRGITADRNRILITSGSGQGLDLINAALLAPGDTVIIEQFTYQGALGKPRKVGADIVGAPLDDHGLDVDRLGELLDAMARRKVRPKYIYTIPTVQNPTGSVLSLERRHKLIEIARHYRVPIFEDDCYADLCYADEAPPALAALDPEAVLYVGSLSKTLAPALRLGYVVADPAVLRQLVALKTDGGTGAVDQMVAAEFMTSHYDTHVRGLVGSLQHKLGVMIDAIEREFGASVELVRPQGGIFVWLRFPEGFDVRRLTAPAEKRGVVFNAGPDWACDPERSTNLMRLCFSLPTETEIRDGVAELAAVCHEVAGFPQQSANISRI